MDDKEFESEMDKFADYLYERDREGMERLILGWFRVDPAQFWPHLAPF